MKSPIKFLEVPESSIVINGEKKIVPGFRISIDPITQGEFASFVKNTGYTCAYYQVYDDWEGPFYGEYASVSLEKVLKDKKLCEFYLGNTIVRDAVEFCKWRGGVRLPSFIELLSAYIHHNSESCIVNSVVGYELVLDDFDVTSYGKMANFPWPYIKRMGLDSWIEVTRKSIVEIDPWNNLIDGGGFRVCC